METPSGFPSGESAFRARLVLKRTISVSRSLIFLLAFLAGQLRSSSLAAPACTPNNPTTAATRPPNAALIEVTPTLIDFGEIWSGEKCETAVAVRNVSSAPVTIYYRANCTGVPLVNGDRIEPGQTCRIPIKIDTTHRLGPINQNLEFHAMTAVPEN